MKEQRSVTALRDRVASLREADPGSLELAEALYILCNSLFFHPAEVHRLADEQLAIAEQHDDDLARARAWRLVGTANYVQVRYTEVHEHLLKALPVVIRLGDRFEYAVTNLILASVSQSTGAYDQGLEQCFKALDRIARDDYREVEAWLSYRISDIYRELGDKDKTMQYAEDCFKRFEALAEETGLEQHRIGAARARTQIGAALQSLGMYQEALDLNLEGLKMYEAVGDVLGRARCLSDIGMIYRELHEPDRAEEYSLQALELRRNAGHFASQSTDLLALGELYMAREDFERSLRVLQEALEIATKQKVKLRAYQAHEALGRLFEARGEPGTAIRHLRASYAIKDELAGEAMNLRIHNTKVLAEIDRLERKAEHERQRGDELARLLAELKATQDKLVQSEKMASLGQLTAGIAHEIKNPLNFVNNFAHLSIELMDELLVDIEERRTELPADFADEMDAIIDDLRINASKIHEHGTRADSIVRSMLEHSRSGPGRESDVELNEFLEEFVNLAWHGAKASDADFQVDVERDYDPTVGTLHVVTQDLGRTFINLLNNAFYAVRERAADEEAGFRGIVRVSTRSKPSAVEIRLADNGTGIPEAVLDHVFEPFFTTKASGTGTGLGLSMSYDIVTKGHGGTIDVESEVGQGTTFIIRLPAQPPRP